MQATKNTTTSSVATQTHMPFPLMRLPGELRNMIYREHFNSVSTQDPENTNTSIDALQPCLNILHANRELRSEAVSIFYKEYVGEPSGMGSSLTASGEIFDNWEITGDSNKSQMQRLSAFCRSLAEHKTTDVSIALRFEDSSLSEPTTPRFVEALTNYMVFQLGDGTANSSRTRVHSNWERQRAEIPGAAAHGKSALLLTRTFEEFKMIYHYDRSTDREDFTLVGPLAKIDWREFVQSEFPRQMDVLELRSEVAVWFAKGSALAYSERTYHDSAPQMPGLVGLMWSPAEGFGHRVQKWRVINQVYLSVYVRPDGVHERDEVSILTGSHRQRIARGDESLGLPASRSRLRSWQGSI